MKTWKRAGLYLIRKKARSILLILITFVMTTFIVAGNAMRTSANQQIEAIRQNLGSSFVVAADTQNESLYEEFTSAENNGSVYAGRKITTELIERIIDAEDIIDYEIRDYLPVWINIKLREAGWADSVPNENFSEEDIELQRSCTNAVFCGNGEMNINFRTGAVSISRGRNILKSDKSKVVISEYLAKKNDLSVGDVIIMETKRGLYEPTKEPFETLGVPEQLEIVGIFSVNFEQEISMFTHETDCVDNFLFVDQYTGLQLRKNLEILFPDDGSYIEVTFFVKNPDELREVMEKVKQTVDLSGLKISLDDSAYSAAARPLRQIHAFAIVLMLCGIVGYILILYLILALWIKERKHEIGILLSIGTEKKKIIWQMILECAAVTTAALLLTVAAVPSVIDLVFYAAEEVTEPDSENEEYTMELKLGDTLPTISKVSTEKIKLSYALTGQVYLLLAIITYMIVSLSVLSASIQIMKIQPKQLLQSG